MKKLIELSIQSYTDVVTNSSSELFIIQNGHGKSSIENLLDSIYPNWSSEYENPKLVSDLSKEELNEYVHYCGTYYNPHPEGTTSYFIYLLNNQSVGEPMEIFFQKRLNIKFLNEYREDYREISNLGCQTIINWFRENEPNTYALFSSIENPNWENQEKLMKIGSRYHLG